MSSLSTIGMKQESFASRARTFFSGTIASTVVAIGPGVLNAVLPNAPGSGVAITIYDGAVASGATTTTSGGPFAASGHVVLFTVPANLHSPFLNTVNPFTNLGIPFNSGLVVVGASGQPSFTLTYTPKSGS